jgi:hypothetical protein
MLKVVLNFLVDAVSLRREFIIFNRVAILILLYFGIVSSLSDTEIGIFGGLFHSTAITPSFDLLKYIIAPIIYLVTALYARRIVQPIFPYNRFGPANGLFPKGYVKAYRSAVMCISVITLLYFCIYSDIDPFLLCAIIPIKSYSNAAADKSRVLKENKGKSGVYL